MGTADVAPGVAEDVENVKTQAGSQSLKTVEHILKKKEQLA